MTMPRRLRSITAFLIAASLAATRAAPQAVPERDPGVAAALAQVRAENEWTLTQMVELCEIPAPPFGEARRAEDFKRRLELLGLVRARIDAEGNVIAERAGASGGPRVMLSAHLDTVFPESTDVRVKRTGTRFSGPGIGDDCRGLAVVLAVARAVQRAEVRTLGDVVFVGTVGEEGPGNLRGVRRIFGEGTAGKVDYFISVDGAGDGLTSRAVGSHRYRVTLKGPGGHSYGNFGMPSPLHALGRAIAAFGDVQVPARPRTTFNVGLVRGGTSVNSIAATAEMDIDLRSESQAALDALDARFREAVARGVAAEQARWPDSPVRLAAEFTDLGKRPAGGQADSTYIVRSALAAAERLGWRPQPGASSTDSNIPMSLGIPSITLDGGGRGGGAHAPAEWYDDGERGWFGPQWALLVVVALAGVGR